MCESWQFEIQFAPVIPFNSNWSQSHNKGRKNIIFLLLILFPILMRAFKECTGVKILASKEGRGQSCGVEMNVASRNELQVLFQSCHGSVLRKKYFKVFVKLNKTFGFQA